MHLFPPIFFWKSGVHLIHRHKNCFVSFLYPKIGECLIHRCVLYTEIYGNELEQSTVLTDHASASLWSSFAPKNGTVKFISINICTYYFRWLHLSNTKFTNAAVQMQRLKSLTRISDFFIGLCVMSNRLWLWGVTLDSVKEHHRDAGAWSINTLFCSSR